MTIALIADHLWQSTLVAGAVGLLTLAFHRHWAYVRHRLWLATSLKFLLPFALLVSAGNHLGWRTSQIASPPGPMLVMEAFGRPFSSPAPRHAIATPPATVDADGASSRAWVTSLFVVWLAGSALVLVVWCVRWRRVASIVRRAEPLVDGPILQALRDAEARAGVRKPVALLVSDSSLEPGVFGILSPALIWPRAISSHLDADQARTILAHEVAHICRRDNLAAAAHMVVQAIFWFHPLVWWIGSRLVDERERACDEDAVLNGGDPRTYAESLLRTCRWFVAAPLACAAGVTGSNLQKRIEHIMAPEARAPLSSWTRALLGAMAAAAVVAPLAAGILNAPLRAQAPDRTPSLSAPPETIAERERRIAAAKAELDELVEARERLVRAYQASAAHQPAPAAPHPAFDVTSVKPNKSGEGRIMMLPAANGGWQATNVTLGMLIRIAYQLQDSQIVGGPTWLFEDRFDVLGSGEAPGAAPSLLFPKLQALLAERFGLVTHSETRELPIFELVPASRDGKRGPNLRPSTATDCPVPPAPGAPNPRPQPLSPAQMQACGMMLGPGRLASGHLTMEQLAANLSRVVGSVVVDRTGLDGYFDLSLEYAPDPSLAGRSDFPRRPPELERPAGDGPSIFAALQEQLGLKLASTKGPVTVLVIDRAEQPMEN